MRAWACMAWCMPRRGGGWHPGMLWHPGAALAAGGRTSRTPRAWESCIYVCLYAACALDPSQFSHQTMGCSWQAIIVGGWVGKGGGRGHGPWLDPLGRLLRAAMTVLRTCCRFQSGWPSITATRYGLRLGRLSECSCVRSAHDVHVRPAGCSQWPPGRMSKSWGGLLRMMH